MRQATGCYCNRCGSFVESPDPMTIPPHLTAGFPDQSSNSQSTNRPSSGASTADSSFREHGPPQQVPALGKGTPSRASGAHPNFLSSAEGDWLGAALGVTSITVDASEASPHCFLVCVRCGQERSLLLPMPAHLFQAAIGSFAAGHRRC